MTEIAIIDWFGRWGHLFSLKTLLYFDQISYADVDLACSSIIYRFKARESCRLFHGI